MRKAPISYDRGLWGILAMDEVASYIQGANLEYASSISTSLHISTRQPDTLLSTCARNGAACQKTTDCSKEIQATLTTCDLAQGKYSLCRQMKDHLGLGDYEYLYLLHRQDKVRDSLGRKWRIVPETKGTRNEIS